MNRVKENESLIKNRAWIEINLNNLDHNISEIKKVISKDTNIMAVVKANAYGHGMILIAKELAKIGITDFAVATLQEAIELRTSGIKGNILILGYTNIDHLQYILEYDLIQTVVDYEYAQKIVQKSFSKKMKVHLKINTGMNRIGENYNKIEDVEKIYQMNNLEILGIYTHLCVSDSLKKEDVEFTKKQINNFYSIVKSIKNLGYSVGKTHIQASYGILNYSEIKCDYVRPGIIMYGVHEEKNMDVKNKLDLKPVLTLKARVTSIRLINKNESVGYGRKFRAIKPTKIATISIGYADGYPRNLSCNSTKVLIHNSYAEIIGRVCMDQLMIDVSNIKEVNQGDVVTLIGEENQISAEEIADQSETITNELLSRLGDRLERIIINK